MRGAQNNAWRIFRFKCLLPTRGAQAPTVAWFQAREAKLWHRRGQIVAARFRKREKLRCHDGADRVASHVLLAGIAAAIAIKPCDGFKRTDFKRLAEYVAGWNRPPASIATFISKHAFSPCFRSKWHWRVYVSSKPVLCIGIGYPLDGARQHLLS
jgi:hypothetical protein